MAADLGGEVGVEAEALEVNAEHLRQPHHPRLLLTVREAEGKEASKAFWCWNEVEVIWE